MASNAVSTTITFVTQTVGDGLISIELDEEKNAGKSSFLSGDTVFFKVYTSPDLKFSRASSAGSVSIGQRLPGNVTERIIFTGEKEATLRLLADSLVSYKWFGADLGMPTLQGNRLMIPAAGIGIVEVTYKTSYLSGNLSGVTIPAGMTEYPVVVVLVELP